MRFMLLSSWHAASFAGQLSVYSRSNGWLDARFMILHWRRIAEISRLNSPHICLVGLQPMVHSSASVSPLNKQLASSRQKQGHAASNPPRRMMKQKQLWAANNDRCRRDKSERCCSGSFNRSGQHFHLRRRAMNASEGYSLWNRHFFPLHYLAIVLKTLWLGNLEFLLTGSTNSSRKYTTQKMSLLSEYDKPLSFHQLTCVCLFVFWYRSLVSLFSPILFFLHVVFLLWATYHIDEWNKCNRWMNSDERIPPDMSGQTF